MQVKKILKSFENEQAYYGFTQQYEMYSLRWLGIIGVCYSLLFLIIDIDRADHYDLVLLLRGIALLLFGFAALLSYNKQLTVKIFHLVCYILSSCLFVIGFLLDFTGGMPIFFLTNYICIHLFAFNSALGHPLKFKIIQTIAVYIFYIIYAIKLSPHNSIHTSQSWNLLLNCTLSLVIGVLMERYKLLNFAQRTQLLESRRKNVELNALKSRLISILSHDLASPLNNLTGLLQLKESNAISETELKTHSEKIKQSLEGLSNMMRNLLKWSKFQLGGFHPQRDKIELGNIVSEVIRAAEFLALQKGIKIINQVKDSHYLYLDSEVLKMAIRNFIVNAIKFSNQGDFITISTKQEKTSLTLSVKDNGIGMSAEQLRKLFTFEKTSSSGTQNEKGSGIGLLITKDFIEMMGGAISAKSVEGKGSEFSVTLPIGSST